MKTQTTRGHVLHTWDALLDMGERGLEVTLPQFAQGTCKSQTISSISFGSQGEKAVGVDNVTNLGENHYISCVGENQCITSKKSLKQRYVKLGFTKVVSSGRAIYINNLVTLGPSKPVMTARVIEHAEKRRRQRRTSRQRASSKAKNQLDPMGVVVVAWGLPLLRKVQKLDTSQIHGSQRKRREVSSWRHTSENWHNSTWPMPGGEVALKSQNY